MQHANDNQLAFVVMVVDDVIAGKTRAQAGSKLLARGAGKRKITERLARLFDLVEQPRRGRLRRLDGNIVPDFGKIGFGRVGQTEGERTANSFLPRSTMRVASKSLTRPAATSASPASMSALSAANSST